MEVSAILKDWREGNGKMVQVGGVWASDPDPTLFSGFHSSTEQAKAYCIKDAELDKLLEEGRSTPDVAKRTEVYQKVQQRIADQAHTFVLYGYPLRWEMWWNHVKGYQQKPSNTRWNLRNSWLER